MRLVVCPTSFIFTIYAYRDGLMGTDKVTGSMQNYC